MTKEEFLDLIRQIESSGRYDASHGKILSGLHKDDRAIGAYGLMPNTIDELIKRRLKKQEVGPDEGILSKIEGKEEREFLESNPRIQDKLASQLAEHVFRDTEDPEIAAYRWNMGHNKPINEISKDDLQKSIQVQKLRELMTKRAQR